MQRMLKQTKKKRKENAKSAMPTMSKVRWIHQLFY